MLRVEQTYIKAKSIKMQHISHIGESGWEIKMRKRILMSIVFVLVATLVYASQRTILGKYWTVVDGELQTRLNVDLPGDLSVDGTLDAKSPIEVGGGLNLHGSGDYFKILVSGVHPNDPELPSAFDKTLIFETIALDNSNKMEIAFWDRENARPSLVLNQGAPNRATLVERSLLVGAQKGAKALDENYTLCSDFPNLECDTSLYGADFGVENNLEALGIIYTDQIKESTLGVGVSFDELKADTIKVDSITIDSVITDLIRVDAVEVNDNVKLLNFAGGGNRTVKVDNNGNLYAE